MFATRISLRLPRSGGSPASWRPASAESRCRHGDDGAVRGPCEPGGLPRPQLRHPQLGVETGTAGIRDRDWSGLFSGGVTAQGWSVTAADLPEAMSGCDGTRAQAGPGQPRLPAGTAEDPFREWSARRDPVFTEGLVTRNSRTRLIPEPCADPDSQVKPISMARRSSRPGHERGSRYAVHPTARSSARRICANGISPRRIPDGKGYGLIARWLFLSAGPVAVRFCAGASPCRSAR
jgi:hypothetical protein